ncbi:MAG: hypothetical protein F4226_02180 [Synechococcus sp. SB0678_bin_12]|nr:hypothetical protein [Synechococcus sp. SB0678_bin_12]
MGMDPETTQSLGFDFAAFLPWMGSHPDVCSLPRGSYGPWGLFPKPLPRGMPLRECLGAC